MLFDTLRQKFGNIESLLVILKDVYNINSWEDVNTRRLQHRSLSPNVLYACSEENLEVCKNVVDFLFEPIRISKEYSQNGKNIVR